MYIPDLIMKIKNNCEMALLNHYSKNFHSLNIGRFCVSSEDIKRDCGADQLVFERQIGYSGMLISKHKNKDIGFIEEYKRVCLGSDPVIREIVIYDNEELSNELTQKYGGKIIICSGYDYFNS